MLVAGLYISTENKTKVWSTFLFLCSVHLPLPSLLSTWVLLTSGRRMPTYNYIKHISPTDAEPNHSWLESHPSNTGNNRITTCRSLRKATFPALTTLRLRTITATQKRTLWKIGDGFQSWEAIRCSSPSLLKSNFIERKVLQPAHGRRPHSCCKDLAKHPQTMCSSIYSDCEG
jgi:hypothetical protein